VEILYALAPHWWGQGLATEASAAVLRFAIERCGLPKIYAGCDPPNVASIRVMERLGMRPDGPRMIDGLETLYYVIERGTGE